MERADQAKHLREAGYDLAQGFHYARPMDAVSLETSHWPQPGLLDDGRVVFPLAAPDGAVVQRESTGRVLVVDDDEAVGVTACRILERHGLRTVLVPTIREAMAELSHSTDVMVVDIGMPDGDGWDLISDVRASAMHARMPDGRDDRVARQRRGAQPCLRPRVRVPGQAVRRRGADREDRIRATHGAWARDGRSRDSERGTPVVAVAT